MKKSIGLIGIFICGLIFSLQSQTIVETSNYLNNSDKNKTISFNELEGIFYASEDPNLKITFEEMHDYAVYFDANDTKLLSNTDVFLEGDLGINKALFNFFNTKNYSGHHYSPYRTYFCLYLWKSLS